MIRVFLSENLNQYEVIKFDRFGLICSKIDLLTNDDIVEKLIFERTFLRYSDKNNIWKVEYDDIISIECDKPYIRFLLKGSKRIITKKSLLDVQKNLNEKQFVRINRKTIVNMENVQSVFKSKDIYSLLMQNGLEYVVSFRTVSFVRKCFFLLNSSEKKDEKGEDENI